MTCRCGLRRPGTCTETSSPASCTAFYACGTSSRTTRTSSAPTNRSTTSPRPPRLRLLPVRPLRAGHAGRASTRPENRLGTDDDWDRAEAALQAALEAKGLEYETSEGEGSFYGPKIDLHMTDSLGRSWQLGTVQLDLQMPKRFGLTYQGADNAEHTPAMIHRALLGSFERFVGIYLEHTGGELPVWLAPEQVRSAGERGARGDAAALARELQEEGFRVGSRRAPGDAGQADPRRRAPEGSLRDRVRRARVETRWPSGGATATSRPRARGAGRRAARGCYDLNPASRSLFLTPGRGPLGGSTE